VRPLEGVRVVDLTRLLPGAYATLLLADLGAEVIKIEDPRGGDPGRHLGGGFALLNRNKRSVTLDLRRPEGRRVLHALAARSDVLIESFRPSTARRLGVDGRTLGARHPRLICASMSGFGAEGPYAERAAHDINYEALAGLLRSGAGDSARAPGALIADVGGAMRTAIGVLAAIIERGRTGAGSVVDVSLYDAALAWSMFPTTQDLESACYAVYETADGEWLALGALESKFWRAFCERIGRPELVASQTATGEERLRSLNSVRELMRTRSRSEWLEAFADLDVCLTPVHTREEARRDPQAAARGLVTIRDGVTYIASHDVQVTPAPTLGADTDAVLEWAGVDRDERARLRSDAII
jgi:crotonobetainyl-CoA:carnitine CoA-transferase CaiB-like acyl-CoA transferase